MRKCIATCGRGTTPWRGGRSVMEGGLAVLVICILLSFNARAQSCNCPASSECGPCAGGFTSLTLQYNGAVAANVTAADQLGTVFSAVVAPGESFTFTGSLSNDKFVGPNVFMTVDGVADATISSLCGGATIGSVIGSFTVEAAISKTGGVLCCESTAIETEPPVISNCPTDFTVTVSSGCSIAVNWTEPTATDNCTLESLTSVPLVGSIFNVGTTTVEYTARDIYGNTSTCSFIITVEDDAPPVLSNCPADIHIAAGNGCEAVATWTVPNVIDNCSATLSSTHDPGDTFPIGTTEVIYTATDDAGNTSTCSFDVFVEDDNPPVFSGCPTDITIPASASCGAVVSWTPPVATDACTVSVSSNHDPGDTFPIGTTEVTYTATDNSGNTSTCSFDVVVEDDNAPVFSGCPTNITIPASASCGAVVSWTPPVATDACTVSVLSNHDPGDTFLIGTTEVTYTATDNSGNTSTCSFDVVVEDDDAPVFTGCPTNITIPASASCGAVVSWTPPVATDECTVSVSSNHDPGDTFPIGTTVVTYTATDNGGNITTCSFNVVVSDNTPPVFVNCLNDITIEATACDTQVSWTMPTVTDHCNVTLTSDRASGSVFPIGTTLVTLTATDDAGNSSQCSFNVQVVDTTKPVISGCPSAINIPVDNSCEAVVSWTPPVVSDNCSASLSASHAPGSVFPIGTTAVVYTASDLNGNTSTCTFNVVVTDQQAPVITNCPATIMLSTAECNTTATWTPPTATGNCSVTTVASHEPGSVFPPGTTTVTYTATDEAGNMSTCSFNVVVNTSNAPLVVADCPDDITVRSTSGAFAVSWTEPTASAVCGNLETAKSHEPGAMFPVGTTVVMYSFLDESGNTATCSFNVVVIDEELVVDVAQAVTPDGNGDNDTWWIGNIEKFPDNTVIVVDRWGNEVFSASGYNNVTVRWDGTRSGKLVPSGTYFYSINLRVGQSTARQTGFIEVIQ